MLLNQYDDDLQTARVSADQQLLFPAGPRNVCQEMGLNWWAALKLHEDGWLGFAPANTPRLDEAQEAELRFVGSLVIAGCDRSMLAVLLAAFPGPTPMMLRASIMTGSPAPGACCPTPRPTPRPFLPIGWKPSSRAGMSAL